LVVGSSDSRSLKYNINPSELEKIPSNKYFEETKEVEDCNYIFLKK
jgi:hypothetical protein